MKKQDAEDLIDVVIAKAPALRQAGVLELGVLGLKLAPVVATADDADTDDQRRAREDRERREDDAWSDPDTFGRRNSVPSNDSRKKG